jgi:hypothetical protein
MSESGAHTEAGTPPSWMRPDYATYLDYEEHAVDISGYSSLVVHGLLQTPHYARRINRDPAVGTPSTPENEADQVARRTQRQERLGDLITPAMFVLTESALRYRPEGMSGKVVADQMRHLREAVRTGLADVRVLPQEQEFDPVRRTVTGLITSGAAPRQLYYENRAHEGRIVAIGEPGYTSLEELMHRANALALDYVDSMTMLQEIGAGR